jgi:hypothetical protein
MNRFELFNKQLAKFQEFLAANNLEGEFKTTRYPISLSITYEQTEQGQMEMFETESDGVSSKDAKLVLTFPLEGIGVHVYGRLVLTDDLMNKIKSHGKKLRDLYLQGFFATLKDAPEIEKGDENPSEEFEADMSDFDEFFSADDEDIDNGEE